MTDSNISKLLDDFGVACCNCQITGASLADVVNTRLALLAAFEKLRSELAAQIVDTISALETITKENEENERLRQALEAAEAQLLDTTWQDHADHWQKRAVAAEEREKRLRELLLKASTYVELTASEEAGEEAAEAKHDLDEINAALAETAP